MGREGQVGRGGGAVEGGRVKAGKGGRVEGWKGGRVEGWKGGRVEGGGVERGVEVFHLFQNLHRNF